MGDDERIPFTDGDLCWRDRIADPDDAMLVAEVLVADPSFATPVCNEAYEMADAVRSGVLACLAVMEAFRSLLFNCWAILSSSSLRKGVFGFPTAPPPDPAKEDELSSISEVGSEVLPEEGETPVFFSRSLCIRKGE